MALDTPVQSKLPDENQEGRRSTRRRTWPLVLSTLVTGVIFGLELGWKDASLLCGVFLSHEIGHFVVGHRGVSCALPFLTPVGAFVAMDVRPSCARDQSAIALAGPLFGATFAIMLTILGAATVRPNVLDVGLFGLGLNLLQLTPAMPFDGGFIAYSFGDWYPLLGTAVVAILAVEKILPWWMLFAVLVGGVQLRAVRSLDRQSSWRSSTTSIRPTAAQLVSAVILACSLIGVALLFNPHCLSWIFG